MNGRLLIGSWVEAKNRIPVHNPFSGEQIGMAPMGDAGLVERAIATASAAFEQTRQIAPYQRAALLESVSERISARKEEFSKLIVLEAGKPIRFAEVEVLRAIDTFKTAAEEARRWHSQEMLGMDGQAAGSGHIGMTRRFPLGVIAGISPFNFPLNLVAHKIAPAIASGNTMVLKPSPKTILTALLLAEVLVEAGMPEGQINVVSCPNEEAKALVADERVRMVSFTGSPDVGWRLKSLSGKKKVTLELGGNAAVVVHEDADLEKAIPLIASGAFDAAGQSCISVQRLCVHESIYERFAGAFCQHVAKEVKTGDPLAYETVVGPLIDSEALKRVQGYLQSAIAAGARILHGGQVRGQCMEATVVENVPHAQELWAKEVFGPVVVLQPYRDFGSALQMVNTSRFGLQAGVFTRDIGRAFQAFEELEVGGVMINQVPTFRVETMPYGGVKESGFGREGVRYAMEEMSELRVLAIRL